MTKKDFIAIAAVVKTELEICDSVVERQAVKGCATGMADHFARINPRFNRIQFLTACGF